MCTRFVMAYIETCRKMFINKIKDIHATQPWWHLQNHAKLKGH